MSHIEVELFDEDGDAPVSYRPKPPSGTRLTGD